MKQLSQEEIDAVAHFREGVAEIQGSPLFIEEFQSLTLRWTGNDGPENISAVLPDEMVVSDVLIPFRRLWQKSEPCFHRRVINIIAKMDPKHGAFVRSFAFEDDRAMIRLFPWFAKLSLSPSDLIDMVINTRYMHVGKGQAGRYTRDDYERVVSSVGPVLLEYAFLLTIHDIGLTFINIDGLGCKPFLARCKQLGHLPSFVMRERQESSLMIERKTPGVELPGTSLPQRLWRLRRRNVYDGLNKFLALINADNSIFSRIVSRAHTFDDMLSLANVSLIHLADVSAMSKDSIRHWSGAIDAHHTALRNGRARRGFVAVDADRKIYWCEDYVPILRDQYMEFRAAFLREPFK